MRLPNCRKSRLTLTLTLFVVASAVLAMLHLPASPVDAQGATTLVWEGRLISDISGQSLGGTIIRVSVVGVAGLPIEVSSAHGGWSTSLLSGSKPELGPYAAEFAGLMAGQYVITPQGTGASLTVDADGTDIITVEFVQVLGQASPTPVPPTSVTEWEAKVLDFTTNMDLRGTVLRVSVVGKIGLPVEVATLAGWSTTGFTGTKPEYGDYVVEFAALQRGNYVIRPQGVDTELQLWLDGRSYVFVEFRRREGYVPPTPTPTTPPPPSPPPAPVATTVTATPPVVTGTPSAAPSPVPTPVTVWTGEVVSNTSAQRYAGYLSTIQVVVEGMKGLPVNVRAGGWNATAVTGTKPECGDFCLEFGGLGPSLYTIAPQGLAATVDVVVEGGGLALIKFTSQLIMPAAPAPTPTPARATITASPTVPPSPTATAAPQMVWAARTLWNTSGPAPTGGFFSAIQVSVAGLKGLPVEIRSGGWNATALTGTKPECGEFCLEFGGLSGSTYVITPEGLGINHLVTVDGEGFAVVEFYQTPAQAAPEVWSGRVAENVSGGGTTGYFAAIQVVVQGKKWLPVEIRAGGWSATELTGTKPSCGGYCLEFGGLTPGTYVITPQGLGVSVAVSVDEGGFARVEFTRT